MQIDFIELPVKMFSKSSDVVNLEELGIDCEEETELYTEKQCIRVDQIKEFYPVIDDDGKQVTKIVTSNDDQYIFFISTLSYEDLKDILSQIGIKIWSLKNA